MGRLGCPYPASLAEPIAGLAELPPDDADPAAEAQDPIDLVSDTSESAEDNSDTAHDGSSAVAVEPIDQAPAEVSSLVDILAARDVTQFLLNGPHAPMVTVSLEEPALARPRTLVRTIIIIIKLI